MGGVRKDKMWMVFGTLAALIVAAVAWFFVVSPQFDEAAAAREETAAAQQQNAVLQRSIGQLRQQAAEASRLTQDLADARTGLPPRHNLDAFTRQLAAHAEEAGVEIVSITPASPSQVVFPDPPAPPAADAAQPSDATPGADNSESSGADTQKEVGTAPTANVYAINVTLATQGTIEAQRTFLALLEQQGPRLALVTSTGLSPVEVTDDVSPNGDGPDDGNDVGNEVGNEHSGGDDPGDTDGRTEPGAESAAPAGDAAPNGGGGPAPAAQLWSMTTQLQIFVAPQSPEQEATLLDQLNGDG